MEAKLKNDTEPVSYTHLDVYKRQAVEDIKSREGWDTITAVQNGDVYQIDKNSSSRASQNVIKALKEIAKAIYPDEYKDL